MENSPLHLLPEQWDTRIQDPSFEEELLTLIADRVQWFLDNDKDLLLSYLYRLDVSEADIDKALTPGNPDPAAIAIARKILDRQKKRIHSKRSYPVDPIEGWEY